MTICAQLHDRDFLIGDIFYEGDKNYHCIFEKRNFSIGDGIHGIKDYAKPSEILGFGIRYPQPIVIDCKLKGMRLRYFKSFSSY